MHKQYGSVILLVLIIITLTSMTSIVVLQTNSGFKKQINLNHLLGNASDLLFTNMKVKIATLLTGIDLNSLPLNETSNHQVNNHNFVSVQNLDTELTIDLPFPGYSLNSLYHSRILMLDAKVTSPVIQTSNHKTGLSCLEVSTGTASNQIDSLYLLDFDLDSTTDVIYQFDSSDGNIWKTSLFTELLIDLEFTTDQSFSRPDFVQINFGQNTKLAIVFTVQNTSAVSPTANNTLYLLLDSSLLTSQPTPLPIDKTELIDLESSPVFSDNHKGYFLELDSGSLINTGLTSINKHLFIITQSPVTNPATGLVEYTNKFIEVDLEIESSITTYIHNIPNSSDLLELQLSTLDHQTIFLSTQYGLLRTLNGECRRLYQYEDHGI